MPILSSDIKRKINLRKIALVLPFMMSFFYLFIRNLSTSSIYIACLIALVLALFFNNNTQKSKLFYAGWGKVTLLMVSLILISLIFYYSSEIPTSYFVSPYSIVLTIVPFLVFFRYLDKEESFIYALIIFFISSGIISYWLGDQSDYSSRVITSRYFKLLYFAPLLVFFKWINVNLKIFIIITSLGIVGASTATLITYCCYDLADGNLIDKFMYSGSVSGNTNPIFFGLITLALTMPLIILVLFKKFNVRKLSFLSVISMLGVANILASESRGVWLSFLIILFFLLLVFYLRAKVNLYKKMLIILFSVFVVLMAIDTQIVQDRMILALNEIEEYQESMSFDEIKSASSFGARVELWKAAVKIFKNNYYFGVGPGGYRSELVKMSGNGEFKKEFTIYNQAHGQYFHILATRGIFGFLTLMSLLVGLLVFFGKNISRDSNQVKYLAGSGIVVIFSYILLSATESPFERRSSIFYFVFYVSLIVASIKQIISSKDT